MKFVDPATGRIQHPHPLFNTWGEAVECFVNTSRPEVGSYVAYDLNGRAVCGRVSSDRNKPHGEVLIKLIATVSYLGDRP